MANLSHKLKNYINNQTDYKTMFNLALEYDAIGQTAAAVSFYLKTAETIPPIDASKEELTLQYASLLLAALCFEKQGMRNDSVRGLIQQAISIYPIRPEGYFLLSRFFERTEDYLSCYLMAQLGLQLANLDLDLLPYKLEYPGEYGFSFELAVSSWWIGKYEESRERFYTLLNKCPNKLDSGYLAIITKNLDTIGYPEALTKFNASTQNLILATDLQEIIMAIPKKNYSQVYQDLFALLLTEFKQNGTYLEIGSSDPFKNSNTALLETKYNWKGISLDYNPKEVYKFKQERFNPCLLVNALDTNYTELLELYNFSTTIDYLQIDCGSSKISYAVLLKIPFNNYTFNIITFDHDAHNDSIYRELSRQYLENKGYILFAGNISGVDHKPFEDWWIHNSLLINKSYLNKYINDLSDSLDVIKYMTYEKSNHDITKD